MMQGLQNNSKVPKNSSGNSAIPTLPKDDLSSTEYEKGTLYPEDLDDRWLRWKCLKCNFVYEGQKPKNVCPKCGNSDPDLFDDAC